MDARLGGCWSNKLVSFVALKERMTDFYRTCSALETITGLTQEERFELMMNGKETLIDAYLMLQNILEKEHVSVQQRCAVLNTREQA